MPDDLPGDTIMPYGKHGGKKLYDIPNSYLDYILDHDLEPEFRAKVKAHLARQVPEEPKDWREGREDADDWRTM